MKKLIDDRGRLFGLLSFIDVIAALLVVLLAAAAIVKFNVFSNPMTATGTLDVDFTVYIYSIRDTNVKHFREGDKLYASDIGTPIGTITNVVVSEAESIESLADGTYVYAKVEGLYDVILTVRAQCSTSNGRYYIDKKYELSVNSEIWMYTKYNAVYGMLMTISTV